MQIREFKNKLPEYTIPGGKKFLDDLKKLNIFVGANNSGKSRYMRSIFQSNPDDLVFFEDWNKKLKRIHNTLKGRYRNYFYMQDLEELSSSKTNDYPARYNEFLDKLNNDPKKNNKSIVGIGISNSEVARAIKEHLKKDGIASKMQPNKYSIEDITYVYVPMLRGLRHIDSDKKDLYVDRTVKDYNLKTSEKRIVFSGLEIYQEIKQMLLGTKSQKKIVENFENFLSENFFDHQPISLVSDLKEDHVKIDIGDLEDYRMICDVGDGIQSIILSTFPAFKYQDDDIVLSLEEPELTMHPSAQRVLIEVLIKKFPKLQVFLTTHSNHFLDLTYDYPEEVAIFSFEKNQNKEEFYIKNLAEGSKILDLLGVRNSSIFLSNCVVWTEGVTDRMLLRKLLEIDGSFNYQEDHHYAFAEYGGLNLHNFGFAREVRENSDVNVDAISNTNYLIIDNDNATKSKKAQKRKELKELLGADSVFDEHVEIENLIPFSVWIEVVKLILKDHPGMGIAIKEGAEQNEKKFNSGLESNKIGTLMRRYVVEPREGEYPDYLQQSSILCLGLGTKKEIMQYVLGVIEKQGLVLEDFPKTAQRVIASINKFIKRANNS